MMVAGALALAAVQFVRAADTNAPAAPAAPKAGAKADALFSDPVIAKGTGVEIKRSQLDDAFIMAKAQAAARGVEFTDADREMLEVQLLDEMIASKILTAKATDADRTKVTEAAEKFIAQGRKQFPTEEAFQEKLKLSKINSVDELEKKIIAEQLPNVVMERELKTQINVTDAAVKDFYTNNPSKFEEPEMVRASHILLMTSDPATHAELSDDKKAEKRKQIDELLKRARGGADFAALAKQYSEDPGSKDNGGEYKFPRGQMVAEFEAAAFALKPGEISDVVTTQFGYHIIKLSEKIPARTVPLTEAAPVIKEALEQREAAKLLPGYIDKLESAAGVEILDDALKAAKKKAQEAAVTAALSSALKH
jgi:peptidyl-prolyl cis-trans isomerase C